MVNPLRILAILGRVEGSFLTRVAPIDQERGCVSLPNNCRIPPTGASIIAW